MPKLKAIDFSVNRIEGPCMRKFLDLYLENTANNNLSLEYIKLKQNFLRDDGVADLFDRLHKLINVNYVNIVANKNTEYLISFFTKFIEKFDPKRKLTIDFNQKDLPPKMRQNFLEKIKQAIQNKDING